MLIFYAKIQQIRIVSCKLQESVKLRKSPPFRNPQVRALAQKKHRKAKHKKYVNTADIHFAVIPKKSYSKPLEIYYKGLRLIEFFSL